MKRVFDSLVIICESDLVKILTILLTREEHMKWILYRSHYSISSCLIIFVDNHYY